MIIKILRISGLLVIAMLCLVLGYFTLFRAIDLSICIPRVAEKLNILPDQTHVYQFVRESPLVGMSKPEVMDRLEKIGSVKIIGTTLLANGEIREGVNINICLLPINNILILNIYDKDWKLTGFSVLEDSP